MVMVMVMVMSMSSCLQRSTGQCGEPTAPQVSFPSLLFHSHFLFSCYLPQIRLCHPPTTAHHLSIHLVQLTHSTAHSTSAHVLSSHRSTGHTGHTAHTAQLHLWPCSFDTHSIFAPIHTCHCDLIMLQAAAELSCISLLLSLAHK
jgi:hypothetical protein